MGTKKTARAKAGARILFYTSDGCGPCRVLDRALASAGKKDPALAKLFAERIVKVDVATAAGDRRADRDVILATPTLLRESDGVRVVAPTVREVVALIRGELRATFATREDAIAERDEEEDDE